jgi:hypothetical protein
MNIGLFVVETGKWIAQVIKWRCRRGSRRVNNEKYVDEKSDGKNTKGSVKGPWRLL